MEKWPRPLAAMFFNETKFFEGIERQSIDKHFYEKKIGIQQSVSEKKIFKDLVPGRHGNKGNNSS